MGVVEVLPRSLLKRWRELALRAVLVAWTYWKLVLDAVFEIHQLET